MNKKKPIPTPCQCCNYCERICYPVYNSMIVPKIHYLCKPKKQKQVKEKKQPGKKIDDKLDSAWSSLVKKRAGFKCQFCGAQTNLHSHHIYSRSNNSVRWLLQNGICLCEDHHVFNCEFSAHETPISFMLWLIDLKGKVFVEQLRLTANSTVHLSIPEKENILKEFDCQLKKD